VKGGNKHPAVLVNGQMHANFRKLAAAEKFVRKMTT
jgi:hypothetical protein